MGAGYSKRSLVDKLGIKSGYRVIFLNVPEHYCTVSLGELPTGVEIVSELRGAVDFIQLFVTRQSELTSRFESLKHHLLPAGMLWVSWPKHSSELPTDLSENIIRSIGLEHGLVDVKVAAIDETWSGLKFVFRLKDRPKR